MQSEAEKLIREALIASIPSSPTTKAHKVLMALTAAGYRILGPDELDPVTVERAANVVETFYLFPEPTSRATRYHLKNCVRPVLASKIRSLSPEAPQPEAKETRE